MFHSNEVSGAIACARKAILLRQNKEDQGDFALPDGSELRRYHDLLLQPYDLPCGMVGDTPERSFELLSKADAGRSLRFESHSIRTTFWLIAFDKEESARQGRPLWTIWYPIYGVAAKETMLWRLYVDAAILAGCGIELSSIRFLSLKSDLVSDPDLPAEEIFDVQENLKKTRGGYRRQSAMEMVRDLQKKEPFEDFLTLTESFFEMYEPDENDFVQSADLSADHSMNPGMARSAVLPVARKVKLCSNPRCPFYDDCFGESKLPDDSSAFLFSSKFHDWFDRHHVSSLAEIDGAHMEGSPMQYAQIQAARTPSGCFIDRPAIESWFKTLKKPVSYLDFEWDTPVLSPYKGMKPFDVLCFQYSLHVEQDDGTLDHTAFFETGDCRVDFIEALLDDLPEEGSILVFNMEGAEKLRLMQLASQFPQYRKPLEAVCERMVDLAIPFESGSYYDLRQRSHSSLKTLLPLFTDSLSYHSLDVGNGVQAVNVYRQAKAARKDEQLSLARAISAYCSMDTIAEKALAEGLYSKISTPDGISADKSLQSE